MSFHEGASTLHYRGGSCIFSEGDPSDCAFVILSGRVAIDRLVAGHKRRLAILGPHALFGEMGAFDGGPRTADAIALEPSSVAAIPAEIVRRKVATSDPFVRTMVAFLIHNLRNADAHLDLQPNSIGEALAGLFGCSHILRRVAVNECADPSRLEMIASNIATLDQAIDRLAQSAGLSAGAA